MAMVLPMPMRLNRLIKQAYQLSIGILLAIFAAIVFVLVVVARVVVPELLARRQAFQPQHLLFLLAAAATLYMYIVHRPRAVYLVEYACFRAAPTCRIPSAMFIEHTRLMHRRLDDGDDSGAAASVVSYMAGMLERSGLGEETCVPPALSYIPPDQSLRAVREEAELVIFSAVDALFAKAAPRACSPGDVDLVVVCCSLCAPAPSFADMVASRYGMRSDVRAVNLSGMGCGAGLIAVDLAARLLRATPRRAARALVVSTEILSSNYYLGKEHSMVRPNCIFRLSGAAMLLSTSAAGARFRLRRALRSCSSADDSAYRCVFQEEDNEGNLGTRVDAGFPAVAGDKVKANLVAFAPGVLPTSELLRVALFAVVRRVLLRRADGSYRPDFRKAFQHFCVHAPAMAVVDTVQHGLGLSEEDAEASRMTLHRLGYTSSSSVLYELAYTEAKRRMRKGDRVWMVSFGAGFECTTVAWECVEPASEADGSWVDCIHRYPVGFVGCPSIRSEANE